MKKWSLVILLSMILLSLSASAPRIGLYDLSDGLLLEDVRSAVNLLSSSESARPYLEDVNRAKDEIAFRIDKEKSIHSALESGNEIPSDEEFTYESYTDKEVISIDRTAYYDDFLSEGSAEAVNQLLRDGNYDLILIISAEHYGQVVSYSLDLATRNGVEELGDSMFISTEQRSHVDDIIRLLSKRIAPDAGFVSVADFPSGASFALDGEAISFSDGLVVLAPGEYTLSAAATGYVDVDIPFTVESGENTTVSYEMERVPFTPVTFASVPSDALFSISGLDGVPMPFTLRESTFPVIATVSKEGFMTSLIQISESSDIYTVKLRPEWMNDEDRVSRAKKNMYSSLRNTLLSLGAVAAVEAIGAVYPSVDGDDSMLVPVRAVTIGISIITLVDLVRNLGIYYSTARESYL